MTVHDAPMPDDGQYDGSALELLTDDGEVWTAVPVGASGHERVSMWLSMDSESVCDLEEWR